MHASVLSYVIYCSTYICSTSAYESFPGLKIACPAIPTHSLKVISEQIQSKLEFLIPMGNTATEPFLDVLE